MIRPVEPLPVSEIRRIRGEKLLRGLNRALPLGRKYHPLVGLMNSSRGLLSIPFGQFRVLRPAAWMKSVTTQLLLNEKIIPEFELLKPICRELKSGLLVDVGANLGLYTLSFRSESELPILAYEPQPLMFKFLEWNIALNKLPNVEARNVACGDSRGEATFWMGMNSAVVLENEARRHELAERDSIGRDWKRDVRLVQEGRTVVKVPMVTLDEDLANIPLIALLKIDCEGFEYKILQGARQTIKRHHPVLFIEIHPEQVASFGDSVQAILDVLQPDYEMEFWYFHIGRHASKLARSLAKFRAPKGHRCADAAEMLAAARSIPGPAQIYLLGRPRRLS